MSNLILMVGTTILLYFIILFLSPDYEAVKDTTKCSNRNDYNFAINILAILLSLMINCLVWGLFI